MHSERAAQDAHKQLRSTFCIWACRRKISKQGETSRKARLTMPKPSIPHGPFTREKAKNPRLLARDPAHTPQARRGERLVSPVHRQCSTSTTR